MMVRTLLVDTAVPKPTLSTPASPRSANCEALIMSVISSNKRRPAFARLAPAGVRRTPPLDRSNKEAPSCSSRCRMRRLSADCLMLRAVAACRKLPCSAAAITLRSELKSRIMVGPCVWCRAKLPCSLAPIAFESLLGSFSLYTSPQSRAVAPVSTRARYASRALIPKKLDGFWLEFSGCFPRLRRNGEL